jgi:exonuclease III
MKALNMELPKKVKVDYEAVATVATVKNQVATLQLTNDAAVASVAAIATQNNNSQNENALEKSFDNPLLVTVYTPNGQALTVLARDDEHKAFLLRMNPNPYLIKQENNRP